jgi:hypothetical protein
MKQLITLSILLLAGPSLASAQETQTFYATTGSMIDPSGAGASYTVSGAGFSTSGVINYMGSPLNPVGPDSPFTPGKLGNIIFEGDTENPNLDMFKFTVNGVPWTYPFNTGGGDGEALVLFQTNSNALVVSGPGTYFSTFTFSGGLLGAPESVVSANPALGCDQIQCTSFVINGGGTAMLDVVPSPASPGSLEVSKVILTFKAPEPSTTSLLLLGFAGLAVLGRRRRPRAALLPAG